MSSQFEFNDSLLTFLADELHSCKYGNFFFNNEFERMQMKVAEKSISVWTVVELHKDTLFRNPAFNIAKKAQQVTSIGHFDSWNIRFWREYFCQFSESMAQDETDF